MITATYTDFRSNLKNYLDRVVKDSDNLIVNCAEGRTVKGKWLGASALHYQYVQTVLVEAGEEAEESTNDEVGVHCGNKPIGAEGGVSPGYEVSSGYEGI